MGGGLQGVEAEKKIHAFGGVCSNLGISKKDREKLQMDEMRGRI
jgi:hypothetical protein